MPNTERQEEEKESSIASKFPSQDIHNQVDSYSWTRPSSPVPEQQAGCAAPRVISHRRRRARAAGRSRHIESVRVSLAPSPVAVNSAAGNWASQLPDRNRVPEPEAGRAAVSGRSIDPPGRGEYMCACLSSASAPRPLPRTAPLACAARVASGDLAGRPRDPNGQTPAAGAAKKARGTCLRPWERGDRAPRATRPTPRRPVGALWMAMQVLSGHPLARVSSGQSDGPAKGTREGELKQLRSLPRDSKFLVGIIWLMSMKGMRSAGPGQQVTGAYATDLWLLGFDFLLARNTR